MPYIPKGRGEAAQKYGPRDPGELNYLISTRVDEYIDLKGGVTYATFNDVLGVLTAVQLELYRRFIGPYEEGSYTRHKERDALH